MENRIAHLPLINNWYAGEVIGRPTFWLIADRIAEFKHMTTAAYMYPPKIMDTATDDDSLFFVDVSANGGASTSEEGRNIPSPLAPEDKDATLFLPSHVTILGNMPVEVVVPTSRELEDADFIQYLEYDETRVSLQSFHPCFTAD